MNILVYAHELAIGGSQINAIELAASVRDRGHAVTVTAPDGPLVDMIQELKLDFVPTPVKSFYPSARVALHLIRMTRALNIDLIHSYEWRPCIEAAFGTHLLNRTSVLMTVMSMKVSASLPRHLPLVVGTRQLAKDASPRWRATLMEPPIDIVKNRPVNRSEARARWGFQPSETVASIVCRLTHEHQKLEGVLDAIGVIGDLAHYWPVRLLIVGDGEGRPQVEAAAAAVNACCGREVAIVAGALLDPRDGYEAADVVLGMGSSAMKAMAFSKPLVVQGTSGFWRLLDENSVETFLYQGWFGHGGGGATELRKILGGLLAKPKLLVTLGCFGRRLVEENFSLQEATERLVDIYKHTIAYRVPMAALIPSLAESAIEEMKFRTIMSLRAMRGNMLGGEG